MHGMNIKVTEYISGFLGAFFFCREKIIHNYVTRSDLLNWIETCDAICV